MKELGLSGRGANSGNSESTGGSPVDEGLLAVAAVMATPVGRRWVLQAGLGGAAAAMLGTAAATSAAAAPSAQPPTAGHGPQDRIVFQFALGAAAKLGDLAVVANGKRIRLLRTPRPP